MLGLRYSDLSAMTDSPRNCLREAIVHWLKQAYNVDKNGKPTWRKIVDVIAEPAGGNDPALAAALAQKHQGKVVVQLANSAIQFMVHVHMLVF